MEAKQMVWFFPGGETGVNKFNIFTGSYIRLMKQIMEEDFDFIKGINFKSPMMNVIWALNNAQKPISDPVNNKKILSALTQIVNSATSDETHLTITSSSSGSIFAAQTACYLAEKNNNRILFKNPFHIVLGASLISTESVLFQKLIYFQKEGIIGIIIHDEVQDEGDNTSGIGGLSRFEAYSNAFGLMMPFFSRKFKGPSFLNTNPETGHIHRKRSKTVQKAIDYIDVVLIRYKLAGEYYAEKAAQIIKTISS
jgi:hypothetical protein